MQINGINSNQNFGFRLSDKIVDNLDKEALEIISNKGVSSPEFNKFRQKMKVIRRTYPMYKIDCYEDYLLNDDALVITVSDKNNREIYNNYSNYKKYGNRICVDSIYDFVMKFFG